MPTSSTPTIPVGSAARYRAYARLLTKSVDGGLDDAGQVELAAMSDAVSLTDHERERDPQIAAKALENEQRLDGFEEAKVSCCDARLAVTDAEHALAEAQAHKGRTDLHLRNCAKAEQELGLLRGERPILFEPADVPRLIRE